MDFFKTLRKNNRETREKKLNKKNRRESSEMDAQARASKEKRSSLKATEDKEKLHKMNTMPEPTEALKNSRKNLRLIPKSKFERRENMAQEDEDDTDEF